MIGVVLSWLVAFNVVNTHEPFRLHRRRHDQPADGARDSGRSRNILPNLGGIDISPVILILLLFFLRNLIVYDLPIWLGLGY